MIRIICLNSKNDLEIMSANRMGYEKATKRFWIQVLGCSSIFYFGNVEEQVALNAMKVALRDGGLNLKVFGAYHMRPIEKKSAPAAERKAAINNELANRPVTDKPVEKKSVVGEAAKSIPNVASAIQKSDFVDKMARAWDAGTKKVTETWKEVAIAAEEESKKDKERNELRKAEWQAKREARAAARRDAEEARNAQSQEDDEIKSEFDEISKQVAAAAEQAMNEVKQNAQEPVENDVVTDSYEDAVVDADIEAEVAKLMESGLDAPLTDSELKEITQLNLDFSDVDALLDSMM